jgi:carbonic anhydrase
MNALILTNCILWSYFRSETHTRHFTRLHSTSLDFTQLYHIRQFLHRYRLHRLELNAIEDSEQRYRRLVELNVIEQCLNLFKTGVVQKRRVATYKEGEYTTPQIHACVFDPNTGDMKRLMVSNSMYSRLSEGEILSVSPDD